MYQFDLRPMRSWSPLFEKEIEKIFEGPSRASTYAPACDIVETEKHFLLGLDVPGLKQEEIGIEVKDNLLHISGERKAFERTESDTVVRTERRFGKFSRVFTLPQNVNQDAIEAHFENGVLNVILPKEEKAQVKKISIGTTASVRN
jgi:HSP20 family protein